MGEKAEGPKERGSQHWIQILANGRQKVFAAALVHAGVVASDESISWVSPKEERGFAEYSDADFLERLGLDSAKGRLSSFWPTGGPWWDGLGITGTGRYLLIEAKAHIGEMVSNPTGATSPRSLLLIHKSLAEVKEFLQAKPEIDWSQCFYQYCNRLAHLYWLREREDIDAELIFLCLTGDYERRGPSSSDEWLAAIELLEQFLGVAEHKLRRHVHHVFLDVGELRQSSD